MAERSKYLSFRKERRVKQISSEVARLREQIQREYETGQRALHDPAMIGSHEFITVRIERIQRNFEELKRHLPEKAAMSVLIAAIDGE